MKLRGVVVTMWVLWVIGALLSVGMLLGLVWLAVKVARAAWGTA